MVGVVLHQFRATAQNSRMGWKEKKMKGNHSEYDITDNIWYSE